MKDKSYEEYHADIHKAGREIKLKMIRETPAKGMGKFRDKLTFYKSAWQAGASWVSLPKEFVYWTSLTPLSIASVNEVFKMFGLPFAIPLSWGSIIAIGTVIGVLIFGILSWSRMGLTKRGSELNALQNPSMYLLWKQNKEIIENQKKG